MTRPAVLKRAAEHIRNIRLAGSRDFAVSGYADGLIVEQDMRGMLLAAADSMDEMYGWIETQLAIQTKATTAVESGAVGMKRVSAE